jgi:hypothetical protein
MVRPSASPPSTSSRLLVVVTDHAASSTLILGIVMKAFSASRLGHLES